MLRQEDPTFRRGTRPFDTLAILGIAFLLIQAPLSAQSLFTLEGRVVDPTGTPVPNALVALESGQQRLSNADGSFRFENLEPGSYRLTADAFGYATASRTIPLTGDQVVQITLDLAPLELDSILVGAREIDIDGRVRDPAGNEPIARADVLTSQGRSTQTNLRGNFDLEVWEEVPLVVRIRAFGYMPLDSMFVPVEDTDYRFDLVPDPLVALMIAQQMAKIQERSTGRYAIGMKPLDRIELIRWDNATLTDVMTAEYSRRRVSRVRCVVLDEEPLMSDMDGPILDTTFARDVARIEFLFDGNMLRVYTQDFLRTMIASNMELSRPLYIEVPFGPPVCG